MAFDPTKPVQTRDGRPARIICTDRSGKFSTVAIVGLYEEVMIFRKDGTQINRNNDLVNIPTKRTGWINIYKTTDGIRQFVCSHSPFSDEKIAKQYGQSVGNCLTTIQIEWEE